MTCPRCKGQGAVRYVYPSNKPIPAYWFDRGATCCDGCDGTGECEKGSTND